MNTIDEISKAYGGCTNCYGKGYATVNDRWLAHDTDQDIGSPGGTVRGGKDFAVKYCVCDRGKQLQTVVERERQGAQLQAQLHVLSHLKSEADITFTNVKQTIYVLYDAAHQALKEHQVGPKRKEDQ